MVFKNNDVDIQILVDGEEMVPGLNIGDLNRDGHFDILAGSYRKGVRIFLGDGRGDFKRILSPAEVLRRRAKGEK